MTLYGLHGGYILQKAILYHISPPRTSKRYDPWVCHDTRHLMRRRHLHALKASRLGIEDLFIKKL